MRGKLSKMSEKRNIRDHKRRLLAAKYELRRKLYKAFCKDPDLPSDMRDKHRYKLSKLPRNSSFARQDDQSESAGEKKRESAKNLSDSVTEQSDDSSVTQDDPTPSTLLSLYTTSEASLALASSPLEAILNAARAPGDRGLLEQMIVDLTQRSILNIEICFIPVYSKNNVSQLAKIKRTHSTVLDQRLNINIPIKDQARRMFAYLALLSCSLLLTYETSLAARFLPFKPAKVGDEKGKEKGPSLVQSFPIDDLSRCISEA
ncbi:UNVERIFIED_CONTAM: Ribosomal protein S14, mitochondrial [Sesamum calycinum]|uniref:Small ribosomal subunit protein uS14m n=1 Tax=Sesamum calycinum TaxID=2727403 RepID=A0AAW2JX10_9LAMI